MSASTTTLSAVQHHARELESCLRLADFAEHESAYGDSGPSIAESLRKIGQTHADDAWRAIALSGVA